MQARFKLPVVRAKVSVRYYARSVTMDLAFIAFYFNVVGTLGCCPCQKNAGRATATKLQRNRRGIVQRAGLTSATFQ